MKKSGLVAWAIVAVAWVAVSCTPPGGSGGGSVTTTTTPTQAGVDCDPFNPHDNAQLGVGCDLSGRTLQKIILTNTYMPETKFVGSTLDRVDLTGSNPKYSNFTKAQIIDSDFTKASPVQSNFTGATIGGTTFVYTALTLSDFTGTVLDDGNDWSGADLGGTIWTGATAPGKQIFSVNTICPDNEHWDIDKACRGSFPGQ